MQAEEDEKIKFEEKQEINKKKSHRGDYDSDDDERKEDKAPKEEEFVDKTATDHDAIFIFCILWSIGAFAEGDDRRKLEIYMHKHTKLKMPRLPDGDSIFNYNVNVHNGKWFHWNTLIEDYVPPDITPQIYSSLLIPNVSSVRTEYLIDIAAKNGHAVLLMGEQGSAKTTMINSHVKKYTTDTHVTMATTFSSTTTPQLFQKSVEGNVDKRMGTTYGPPAGKKLLIFIDDVNLPSYNEWGDQVTNELLRQLMEMKGFYSLEKPGDFSNIVDVHYLAAMIQPGGGRNDVPQRLKRHFVIYNCTLPTNDAIDRIFLTIAKGHYNESRAFPEDVCRLAERLVPVTRVLWYTTKSKMMPTPAKFHYVFNLRDLSRIWLGMIGTIPTVVVTGIVENVYILHCLAMIYL